MEETFWLHLDALLASADHVIDRPKGSRHPRIPSLVYPLDYGYLRGISSSDGNELDAWYGTGDHQLDAIICTVDLLKKDAEIKLLVGCTDQEKAIVLKFHNDSEYMAAILIRRK